MGYVPQWPVNIPTTDYLDLEHFLLETRPNVKPDDFIRQLLSRWLKLETERHELRKNGRALCGYQWKSVFLPDGTHLRSISRGESDFAKVVRDKIVSDDGAVWTPSRFANRYASGRNAWRFIWLRFPGEEHWIRAAHCRERGNTLMSPPSPACETL